MRIEKLSDGWVKLHGFLLDGRLYALLTESAENTGISISSELFFRLAVSLRDCPRLSSTDKSLLRKVRDKSTERAWENWHDKASAQIQISRR